MTLKGKLSTLRKLLEAKMVKCPSCHGTGQGEVDTDQGHGHTVALGCGECGGTGHIREPAYIPLLEVVLDLTPHSEVFSYDQTALTPLWLQRYGHFVATRSWEGLPKGALAGALFVASLSLPSSVETHGAAFEPDLLFQGDDSDDAALDILIEALEKGE